jgi:hypothetical protein
MISETDIRSILNADVLISELHLTNESLNFAKKRLEKQDTISLGTPENVRHLAHYAAIWGITDDGFRSEFVRHAPSEMKQNLKWVVMSHEEALMDWLGGPESDSVTPTRSYLAFGAMVMASDSIAL